MNKRKALARAEWRETLKEEGVPWKDRIWRESLARTEYIL